MKRAFLLLCSLTLPLAGCHRHSKQVLALPPAPPETAPVMVSVPPPSHPTEPLPATPRPVMAVAPPKEKPARKPSRTRRTPSAATAPAATANTAPAATPPVQTATASTPAISLGQLSAGGETTGTLRQQTINLIHSQTQRVNGLQASFINDHRTDVEQTRQYIRQAQEAWNTSDVEAAHTLATKAKVLLDDLLK